MKRIALITGCSAGIGEAIAEKLANENINLILNARRNDRLSTLSEKLKKKYNIEILPLPFDVRKRNEVAKAINSLDENWRKINFLVNNAGLAAGMSSIENGDIDDWDTMIDTNIKGLLYVTRNVLPLMIETGNSHIINIGSIAGKENYANGNVYCSTKAAVDMLNRSMRVDLIKYPVKVTAIHPGAVETEFSIVRFKGDETRAKKVYEGFDNLVAADVAEAVWFALSRPPHVNINELTIMPLAQPAAGVIHRK